MRLLARPLSKLSGFSGMFALALVLAVLLGVLAVLQYRWVGQLSADERDRIKDHLKDSADDFAEDFNRELTRLYFWLQFGPVVRQGEPPEPDALRYEKWFGTAEHPDLVATIYQVDTDDQGRPTLQQFFRQQPRLEKAEWPAALEPIRAALIERQKLLSEAATAPPGAPPPPPRVALLWPDISTVVVPRIRVVTMVPNGTSRQLASLQMPPVPSGYTIAVLNPKYLRQQLIPRLVERHFTKEPDGALQVAVKDAHGVVFATEGAAPALFERADVRESLWEIRFHEFPRFVTERRAALESGQSPAPPSGPASGPAAGPAAGSALGAAGAENKRQAEPRVAGAERRDGDRGGERGGERGGGDRGGEHGGVLFADREIAFRRSIVPPPAGAAAAPQANITVMYRNDDRGRPGGGRAGIAGQPWQVHVLHSAGSLDAAVGRARSRNLLVSFGVLVTLGASMTLVLISSARARRLAAQQMEFVAGVSHELRTPLAVIRSAAENLADGIIEDDKQVRRYGQLIAGEGRRLTQMVEQVMTFAGLQAGRPGFDVRPIDIGPVLEEALSAVAPVAREQEAEIATDLASALPRIMGDPSAVARALQNLLGNALKYGGEPPRITVSARLGTPRGAGRQQIDVAVSDNGPGIAPRDLPHIFEPFYRGADAVAKQIHGSGLGLSLVQRIMQELGGRVSVASAPGQGTTFTLHLPVAPETELIAHASPVAMPADR